MDNKRIGYFGVDHYDIVIYMARVLYHMGKSILMVDHSDTKALSHCIPIPKGLDPTKNLITSRGIDFTMNKRLDDLSPNYDVTLISYGFQSTSLNDTNLLDKQIIITDLQLHHIEQIDEAMTSNRIQQDIKTTLLIKDVIDCMLTPERIEDMITKKGSIDHCYILYQDTLDLKSAILCQSNHATQVLRISRLLKRFIFDEIMNSYPDTKQKKLKEAYHEARRGS
ncbi:MAG: hypothetical protein K0S47_4086 [Herbinix sp.]|jgi:hypothetical protein|nr:hypothetical protein [Herbinix sp.]